MKAEDAIDLFNLLSILFSILLMVGLLKTHVALFQTISFVVKIIVGCLLLYRFNDYYPAKQFTIFDRKVCFLAGWYIILFTLGDMISSYLEKIKQLIF
jgi:hypothetical protein